MHRASDQFIVLVVFSFVCEMYASFYCLYLNQSNHFIQHFPQIKRYFFQFNFSGLHLTHIQNIVYQFKQKHRRTADFFSAFLLLFHIFREMIPDIQHTDHAIDRCSDIVAHPPQKLCFCNIGTSRFFSCLNDLILIFLFSAFLLINILHSKNHRFNFPVSLNSLRKRCQHMPDTKSILKRIIQGFLSLQSFRKCVDICNFPHPCLILLTNAV